MTKRLKTFQLFYLSEIELKKVPNIRMLGVLSDDQNNESQFTQFAEKMVKILKTFLLAIELKTWFPIFDYSGIIEPMERYPNPSSGIINP